MAGFGQGEINTYGASVNPVDTSFLQYALQSKNQQYEQGLNQVKSIYSSVLNSPLSNPENQQARDQYIAEAQDNIKTLSKADLSLPNNVSQAGKIFAPFYSDPDIVADINKTKQIQNQVQTGYADRDSKDSKINSTFNQASITRLGWAKKDLQEAKRGDGSIQSIEIPNYLPHTDPNQMMIDYNTAAGFKGNKYTTHREGYLLTTTNGVQAIPDFETRAAGVLGSKLNPQFAQEGYNKMRSDMEVIKKANPNFDQTQIIQNLANTCYDEYRGSITGEIAGHQDFINTLTNHIKDIDDNGSKLTPKQMQDKRNLQTQIDEHNTYLQALQDKLTTFDNKYKDSKDLYPELVKNPEEYYGQSVRSSTIHNMAETLASNRSIEEDQDKTWEFKQNQNQLNRDYNLRVAQFKYEQKHDKTTDAIAMAKINAELAKKGMSMGADGKINIAQTSSVTEGMHNAGAASTSLQNMGSIGSIIEDQKNTYMASAINSLTNPDPQTGYSTIGILSRLGVTDGEIADLNTFIKRRYSSENYNSSINFAGNEQKSYEKVKQLLENKLKIKINYSDDLINGIGKYIINELQNSNVINQPAKFDSQLTSAFSGWTDVKDAKDNYDKINREQQELVNREAISPENKEVYKKILSDDKARIADKSDMVNRMPTLQVRDAQNNIKTITPDQLAQGYKNKTAELKDDLLSLNGRNYTIDKVNGQNNYNSASDVVVGVEKWNANNAWRNVMNRFGTYEERDNLYNKLYSKADENFSKYKNKTGREGRKIYYDMAKTGEEAGNNEQLGIEAMNPANQLTLPQVNGVPIKLNSDEYKYLEGATRSTDAIIKNQLQFKYNTISGTSPRSVEVTIPDDDAAKGLKGQTVVIPISPNASGSFLSKIPINSGIYVWDKMNNGDDINATLTDKSMGFDYGLTPDDRNHPSIYNLRWSYTKFDPTADIKTYPNHLIKVEQPPLPIKLANTTPDEIREKIKDLRTQSVNYLIQSRAQYNKKNTQ